MFQQRPFPTNYIQNQVTEAFLSCDWGTSSFRLKLVNISDLEVRGEVHSDQGIAATYRLYEAEAKTMNIDRQAFYLDVIAEQMAILEEQLNISLDNVPVVLSGMASSTIGILSMRYAQVPFTLDGKTLATHSIKASSAFKHDVLIISGVSSSDDVIRGEETQLIGCVAEDASLAECLYIFPGTHSKHIVVSNHKAVSFTTYMTGELFALLSTASILSSSVTQNNSGDIDAFKKGVADSVDNNLLHAAFLTRTNDLFGKFSKEENYNYLSGLLIGTELKDLTKVTSPIVLCASGNLQRFYSAALEILLSGKEITIVPSEQVDKGLIKGQLKIFLNKKTV